MSSPSPEAVLRMARGFMESRILLTAAELDLFTLLADDDLDADAVCARLGVERRPIVILLDALAAMGLLAKSGGRYQTPREAATILANGRPDSVLPMVLHAAGLWHRWARLTDLARGAADGAPTGPSPDLTAFIGAMHVVGAPLAERIVAAVDAQGATNLIDIGGASGTYTVAFLRAVPGMRATLFDRPPVVEMAREHIEEAGLLHRVNLAAGDFYVDPLPPGHDLAFLSAIIHQNSREQNVALYQKVHGALVPGGRLVIRDHVMSADRIHPPAGALFAVNMLVATPEGGTYTLDEIRDDLLAGGFGRVRQVHDGSSMDSLVEAYRP
ncbi:MAG: hypothetical protein IT208_14435 [Chthonomonadales bacterium]|nr:hypothetical protein [Chthonomonadales bacterium]